MPIFEIAAVMQETEYYEVEADDADEAREKFMRGDATHVGSSGNELYGIDRVEQIGE